MKKSLLIAAVASMLTVAHVQAAEPGLGGAKPGSYKVESYHTQVGFSLSHFGFTNYSGLFSGATGSLRLDPAHPAASKLDVTIPVDSIVTTVPKLTDELKGDKWFDVAKFPRATFTSTNVTLGSGEEETITGNFNFHGITKPAGLHAHP